MRRIALSVALLTLVSCGGDNGGGTTPTQPVTPVATSITLSSSSVTLESLGATSALTATVKDQTGAAMTGQTISWSSSDDAIATVANGTVTAVANGSATVTATSGTLTASASVTVSQVAASVAITPSALSFASLTDTVSVSGQIADARGNPMEGGSDPITWSVSDTMVASVSAEGLVTSVGNGSGSITATSGSLTGSVDVTVDQIAASLTLSEDSVTFRSISDSLIVSASGADALGSSMDSVAVAWTTSDSGVATVTDGLVRPIASGTASITATAGEVSATLSVVVGIEYFYLAENGVTVMCPDAAIGDTGVVNGITYTKRDRAGLDALRANVDSNPPAFATTCTSGVTDLRGMFGSMRYFDQDIGSWDVGGVTDMAYMFNNAREFNHDIGDWDVSNVLDMERMFQTASTFDQDIGGWDVGSVERMQRMFNLSLTFNQDISAWDVAAVTSMEGMFMSNEIFNQEIGGWDVGRVADMSNMFLGASSFAADISAWDVSAAQFMFHMFQNAYEFDADLSVWCVSSILSFPTDFDTEATSWSLPRPVWGTCSPASTIQTTVTADPSSILPNGTSTITVQLKDASGTNVTASAGELTFATPSDGSVGTVTDNGDGTYSAIYTAGSTEGTVTLTPSIDGGLKVLPSVDVSVQPAFYLAANGVTVMCPNAAVGDTGVVNGITYTKRDRAGLVALVTEGKSSGDYSPLASSCTSGVTYFEGLFYEQFSFREDIAAWDVSHGTDFGRMFLHAWAFSSDLSAWDVGNAQSMFGMFAYSSFNADISGWDVGAVTRMGSMFLETPFNQPIGGWDVSKVTDMSDMFAQTDAFNADIGAWNVAAVTSMQGMFRNAAAFDQPIGSWNVSKVTSMTSMFSYSAFNQDISGWDVSRVEQMRYMFTSNKVFDNDLSEWDVRKVVTMEEMFHGAASFDGQISGWDVSNVVDMNLMFQDAASFNRDLSGWCVTNTSTAPSQFDLRAASWTLPRPVWGTCSPASLYQSTLTASATSIPADGASTVTLTVQLRDVDGVNLTENTRTLTFDAPSQGSISAVTVNNDGTYTATYTAGSTAGTVTILGRLDGVAMTQTVTITLN
jgi:hypothetical protein